ncbi:coronin-7-like [Tropilaelaps mercedesae]|uniref:Coronin-7-like n=1 Tax=Tropilaelaps mercedesae TaxID=418985 RepID=A0A1V9XKJ6_9ACAR|nr:coronin-7-like [Tropilaelaps mercedesae]
MASMRQRMQYEDDEEILPQERMQGAEDAEWTEMFVPTSEGAHMKNATPGLSARTIRHNCGGGSHAAAVTAD